MADYRQIHVHIWKDAWFMDLDTEDKLLFIYLFSNERASVAGIYPLSVKVMAFETGLTKERIASAMSRFANARKVFYQDGIVWVTNLRKYNANKSPKVSARIRSDLEMVPPCPLKTAYVEYYKGIGDEEYPMDRVSIPYLEMKPNRTEQPSTTQEQEQEGAGAPPPKPSRKSELMDNPAVVAYRDKMLVTPSPAARQAMAAQVKDLELWGKVLAAWAVNSYNPQNVAGLLDAYSKGGVNGNGNRNGRTPVLGTSPARKPAAFSVKDARRAGDQ